LFSVGLLKKSFMFIFRVALWIIVSIYHAYHHPSPIFLHLLHPENLNFIKLFLTTTTCPCRVQGGRWGLGNEGILPGAQ
jgi:hypothetical protein